MEAIETPSSSNGGGVASFVKSVLSLKDKHGILQRWHQVAFQRELLVRNAQDSVRKVHPQRSGDVRYRAVGTDGVAFAVQALFSRTCAL